MKLALSFAALATTASLSLGCLQAPLGRHAVAPAASMSEYVSAPRADVRDLTVQITAPTPRVLRAQFAQLAKMSDNDDWARVMNEYATSEGAGSGFVLVHRAPDGRLEPVIVTNRHVVEFSAEPTVTFANEQTYPAHVLYVDDDFDLAVLTLDNNLTLPFGLDLETAPIADRQTIVATGYPALGDRPSYQATEGRVSNHNFRGFDDDSTYIQHTAPIDPGSSGGPLTNEAGHLVGVNTLKVRGRDNVYLAIPAEAVHRVVRTALGMRQAHADVGWRRNSLVQACRAATAELQSAHAKTAALEAIVASEMVQNKGHALLGWVMRNSDNDTLVSLNQSYLQNPQRLLRITTAFVLRQDFRDMDPATACSAFHPRDLERADRTVRMAVRVHGESREIVWAWERGHWKIADAELAPKVDAPKAKDAAPPKKQAARAQPTRAAAATSPGY